MKKMDPREFLKLPRDEQNKLFASGVEFIWPELEEYSPPPVDDESLASVRFDFESQKEPNEVRDIAGQIEKDYALRHLQDEDDGADLYMDYLINIHDVYEPVSNEELNWLRERKDRMAGWKKPIIHLEGKANEERVYFQVHRTGIHVTFGKGIPAQKKISFENYLRDICPGELQRYEREYWLPPSD